MKRFSQNVTLLAAMFSIIGFAVSGCGKGNDTPPTTGVPGAPGMPGYGGGVSQPLPGGGTRVAFSGSNVYDTGVRITGASANYGPGVQATLTLGATNLPVGQPGTITGHGYYYPSTVLNMIATPSNVNPLTANVAGAIDLDPMFVQQNFPSGVPAVIAIAIDVYTTGTSIYGGTVWLCTTKDSSGNCHGAYIQF